MNKDFIEAVDELEKSKGISKELLFEAIEAAMISAYKKNYNTEGNVEVNIDRTTGDIEVLSKLTVVDPDEIENEDTEITLEDAQEIDPDYELGDEVVFRVTPDDFGRIAAQTAKQVIVQRIREAERGIIYDDYIERVGDVLTGTVQRKNGETIFVNLGTAEGILSVREQVRSEHYRVNDRIKVYVMDVKHTTKGPQIFLSRSHPGLVKRLFELEVPEIEDGIVEIRSIAREAGSRTKIAVSTEDENVDPVGACVGTRGSRVQSIVDELFNEKIDIINWSDDPVELIGNVLSPARVEQVMLNEEEGMATVIVPDYQLSLAIGRSGQNVRLAAKLCGWKIDIKSHSQYYGEDEEAAAGEESYGEEYYDEDYADGEAGEETVEYETGEETGAEAGAFGAAAGDEEIFDAESDEAMEDGSEAAADAGAEAAAETVAETAGAADDDGAAAEEEAAADPAADGEDTAAPDAGAETADETVEETAAETTDETVVETAAETTEEAAAAADEIEEPAQQPV